MRLKNLNTSKTLLGHLGLLIVDGGVVGHDALPQPVSAPHVDHLLNRQSLSLRQVEDNEDGHDHHPPGEEEEDAVLEVAQDGEEDLSDDEGLDEVDTDSDRHFSGASLDGEDLTGHQPPERAPRPGERRDVDADEDDKAHGLTLGKLGSAFELEFQDDGDYDLTDGHLNSSLQEQHATAPSVDYSERDESGYYVDGASSDG